MTKKILFVLMSWCFVLSCDNTEGPLRLYNVSGKIVDKFGQDLEGIKIFYTETEYVLSNELGEWIIEGLGEGSERTLVPTSEDYAFFPINQTIPVTKDETGIAFTATHIWSEKEKQVLNWFNSQQLANGLLESAENSNFVSLYDNALAALVFLMNDDITKAENVFDFFNAHIDDELLSGNGGFSQFRDRNGVPNNNRWLGDNAWFLIALNNHKAMTGNNKYERMISELSNWIMSLQDTDGGIFGGYRPDGTQIHKITEGNIDAFNAISGYTDFHKNLLDFLKNDRWNETDQNLMAWVGHPQHEYALDLHPWSYCMFPDYPISTLTSADRYLTTQTATTTGAQITGYCFDEDQDAVWLEGTGQMAIAFVKAGMQTEANFYLTEMEKVFVISTSHADAFGFPYASNLGTSYGSGQLWQGADTNPVISSGAWYLFAQSGFNPFEVEFDKAIPEEDKFWLD